MNSRKLLISLSVGLVTVAFPNVKVLADNGGHSENGPNLTLTNYVNLFVGTDVSTTGSGFSGNDNPGAQTPFGMVSFGPDTQGQQFFGAGAGGYLYSDPTILFFSLTHLNGPGCIAEGGGGGVLPSVSTDQISVVNQGHNLAMNDGSGNYDHANESAHPGYYKVTTANGVTTELTATTRTGMARFTYPAASKSNALLVVDSNANDSNKGSWYGPTAGAAITLDATKKTVSGTTVVGEFCGGTWKKPVYFFAEFDTPVTSASSAANGVAILQFDLSASTTNVVQYKVGVSSVSVENAQKNLQAENNSWDFDATRNQADAVWERSLNTIQVDLAQPDQLAALPASKQTAAINQLTQFYTAFYRTFSGPTVYSDVNGEYRGMHQADLTEGNNPFPTRPTKNVGTDDAFVRDSRTMKPQAHYSGYSIWDIYRNIGQLHSLLFPAVSSDMMQSLVADAEQAGAFPHWVDASDDTTPMEGNHAPNLIAGSYAFGARDFDTAAARNFMIDGQTIPGIACNDKPSVDRTLQDPSVIPGWLTNGYILDGVPANNPFHTSSLTIEMVTADRSVGAFLSALPTAGTDQDIISGFFTRAGNWRKILDPTTKTLGAVDSTGQIITTGNLFHESTEPNYFWDIGHDYTALITAIGGKAAAVKRLDTLFGINRSGGFPPATPPSPGTLNGGQQSQQFYIGNEPAMPDPWGYNWAGSPQSAQYIIPVVMQETFNRTPQGFPGNDDMGAISGWYVWATLGFYPTVPSAPGLAMSTPQFSGITVWLGNGKKLRIETDRQAMLDNAPYINTVTLNGKPYQGSWLPLAAFAAQGGTLRYTLSTTPTTWGDDPALTPPSGPNADYTKSVAAP
jgi:predicted alpha-1,2-mannosidase